MLRISAGIIKGDTNSSNKSNTELAVGSRIRRRISGEFVKGTVTRVRLGGKAFDISFDNGNKEIGVGKDQIELISQNTQEENTANKESIEEGSRVEGNYRGRGKWYPGKITRDRYDGTYDIAYDDGESETRVEHEFVRKLSSKDVESKYEAKDSKEESKDSRVSSADSEHRAKYFSDKISSEPPVVAQYSRGNKVACYWYRPLPYGCSKLNLRPKAAVVLKFNTDNTYTVELEKDGSIIDDVPPQYLKDWSVATEDLNHVVKSKEVNIWAAVMEMAKKFTKQGKIKSDIPSLDMISRMKDVDNMTKLKKILGENVVTLFVEAFKDEDINHDKELDFKSILKAFDALGGRASVNELRTWTKIADTNGKSKSHLAIDEFIIAFANIFHAVVDPNVKGIESVGKSLGLSGEWKNMAGFAKNFGKKLLSSLENAFDTFAKKDDAGVMRMFARDLLEAFHKTGYAITVTRLSDWMHETDVHPQDSLTLADFASIFSFFFNPSKMPTREQSEHTVANLTLSEIAVLMLQEERWRGNMEQMVNFIQRLCSGRSAALEDVIVRIRDAFESLDPDKIGEVSISSIKDIFRTAKLSNASLDLGVKSFTEKMKRQSRGKFSFPEIFEFFGPVIQDAADATVSIAEAFAMLRLHLATADIRLCADMAMKVVDNVINNANNSKFWQINVKSEEFFLKIWQYDGGKVLMKAIGFGETFEVSGGDGKVRTMISLKALPSDLSKVLKLPNEIINSLKSRRYEIDQEIVAMEGAPSVSSAIREMRSKHTIHEVRNAIDTALIIVRNILTQPKDIRMYRIKRGNPQFHSSLGRLHGSDLLMRCIGFSAGSDRSKISQDPSENVDALDLSTSGIYVLKSMSTIDMQVDMTSQDLSKFKFPSLDPETERFLMRRKADLELALRHFDNKVDDSASGTVKDAARVLGTTATSLNERSAKIRKTVTDSTNKGTKDKSVEKGAHTTNTKAKGGEFTVNSLKLFLQGATAAQQAQICMIKEVFELMDADKDGLLSVGDVRAYFRAIGRNASDLVTRKWIRERDIDQDGAVSLAEFVGSYSHQLDPSSKFGPKTEDSGTAEVSPIAIAFGTLRLGNNPIDVLEGCNVAEEYIRRVLDNPSVQSFWRIQISDELFQRRIGRLFGGVKLMTSLGFQIEDNGQVLALRDNNGKVWTTIPQDIRVLLNSRLEELISHKQAIQEPTISNVAAVSSAIEKLGDNITSCKSWESALEAILLIITNIIRNPGNSKYYLINASNPSFHKRVGSIQGCLEILISLGFREEEGGSLVLPIDSNLKVLEARRLELEVGINLLRHRIANDKSCINDKDRKDAKNSKGSPTRDKSKAKKESKETISDTNKEEKLNTKAALKDAKETKVKDESVDSKKIADTLQEEKTKRLMVETALQQTKALVHELQSQVSSLQDSERRNLNARQSLTISRLDSIEKQAVMKQAQAMGKDSFAFKDTNFENASPNVKEQLTKVKSSELHSKDDKKEYPVTTLSVAAQAGDQKLEIKDNAYFRNTMKVLIGAGANIEMRVVKGLGSIIIDRPLIHNHPVGTIIRGFPSNVSGTAKCDHILSQEFMRNILEEIYETAVLIGDQNLLDKEINDVYSHRAVLNHSYTYEVGNSIQLNDTNIVKCMISTNDSKTLISHNNGLSTLEFALSACELVVLFQELTFKCSLLSDSMDHSNVGITADEFMNRVKSDNCMQGIFEKLASIYLISTDRLLEQCFDTPNNSISWGGYLTIVKPSFHSESMKIPFKFDNLDSLSCTVLSQFFELLDHDCDELISDVIALSSFAELDGIAANIHYFNQALIATTGSECNGHLKISLSTYVSLRYEYARINKTHPAGLRLYGRILCYQFVDSKSVDGSQSGLLSATELSTLLPMSILDSLILPVNKPVSYVLSTVFDPVTKSMITDIVTGGICFGRENRLYAVPCGGDDIVELLYNDKIGLLYALSKIGVVTVYDSTSYNKLFEQRIIWAEPIPTRRVEGNERFDKWRKDSGIGYQGENTDLMIRANETVSTSSSLSSFMCNLSEKVKIMATDDDCSVLAINCALTSDSICFLDPMSLHRIYRVKAPTTLSTTLTDAIQSISCGQFKSVPSHINSQQLFGVISDLSVFTKKSLLICKVVGSKSLMVMSMLTGEPLLDLLGHTAPVTCLLTHEKSGYIYSGSSDATVRVWRSDDCISHRLAVAGFEDASTKKVESRLTKVVAPSTKHSCKSIFSLLCSALKVAPRWRSGKICGFFDGDEFYDVMNDMCSVEVMFDNGCVQCVSNHILLRKPAEVQKAPNGPPIWSNEGAQLRKGSIVSIYDVDPEDITMILCRHLGASRNTQYPVHRIGLMLASILQGVSDEVDAETIVEATGLDSNGFTTFSSIIKRIVSRQDKFSSKCDRVLCGNFASIVSIAYLETSKLLITMDIDGCVCVWDPCCFKVSLNVKGIIESPSFIGKDAFSMVARHSIGNKTEIMSTSILPVIDNSNKGFILETKALMKAYSMDSIFKSDNSVIIRGFIYVMKDLSFHTIESSCFLPGLVAMSSPSLFFQSDEFSMNETKRNKNMNLSDIYVHRDDIIRIVYTVSCAHSSIKDLALDLQQYGVLSRGVTTTPSAMIEVSCFERLPLWLENVRHQKNYATSNSKSLSGVIIGAQDNFLKVALDYSNDVVHINHKDVIRYFDKYERKKHFQSDVSSTIPKHNVGTRVEIVNNDPRVFSNKSSEVLLVSVRSDKSTSIIPLCIGRSSFPIEALYCDQLLHSSVTIQLSRSYIKMTEKALNSSSCYAYLLNLWNGSWRGHHAIFASNTMKTLQNVHDSNFNHSHELSTVTAFSSTERNVTWHSLQCYLQLAAIQRAPLNHPLMQYLDSLSDGHNYIDIFSKMKLSTEYQEQWQNVVEKYQMKWIGRLGLHAEEVYGKTFKIHLSDVEHVFSKFSLINSDQLVDEFGRYSVHIISLLLQNQVSMLSSNVSIRDVVVRKQNDPIGRLMFQHFLNGALSAYDGAIPYAVIDALQSLLSYFNALAQPLLSAVRDVKCTLTLVSNISPKSIDIPRGQFTVCDSVESEVIHPGLRVEVWSGNRTRNQDTSMYNFLVWKLASRDENPAIFTALSRSVQHILNIQKDCPYLLRYLEGVTFSGPIDTSGITTFEWSHSCKSLQSVLKFHGPYFQRNKLEVFRIIASQLIDAVIDINDRGLLLRSLSPSSIILDETGLAVRILPLPTACDINAIIESETGCFDDEAIKLYLAAISSEASLISCIPNFGERQDFAVHNWDAWSVGACLFHLAFGYSIHSTTLSSTQDHSKQGGSQNTSAANILFRIMESKLRNSGDPSQLINSLQILFDSKSQNILFQLFEDVTGESSKRLSTFLQDFCSLSPSFGLTSDAANILWDKLIQAIFVKIASGNQTLCYFREKMATIPKDCSISSFKDHFSELLGIPVTKQEFEMLVESLSMSIKSSPFNEKFTKSMKSISGLLEEIYMYGSFQQLLSFLSTCLCSESQFLSLADLRRMPLFNVHDSSSRLKASQEAKLLLSPFANATDFVDYLKAPILKHISVASSNAPVDADVLAMSNSIGRIEELLEFSVNFIVSAEHNSIGPLLTSSGANTEWLISNCIEIVALLSSTGLISLIALVTLQFLGTDIAQVSDDKVIKGLESHDVRGLSLGSKLLMRVAKFMQYIAGCIATTSRSILLYNMLSSDNLKSGNSKMRCRQAIELLFYDAMAGLMIFHFGEESSLPLTGSYAQLLCRSHKAVYNINVSSNIVTDSRWSSQLNKLFDPIIKELVGDDGKGTTKVQIGMDCLALSDKVVLSVIHDVINNKVASNCINGCQLRGSLYFSSLLRLSNDIVTMDAAFGKSLIRYQLNFVLSALNTLPNVSTHTESNDKVALGTTSFTPDSGLWQRFQLFLDYRLSSRLQSLFSTEDVPTKIALIKVCIRVLTLCSNMDAELSHVEPCLSIALNFSEASWIQGITDSLRGKITNLELALLCVQSLKLMAFRKIWMRNWVMFDVLQLLLSTSRVTGSQLGDLRVAAKSAYKLVIINFPEYLGSMIDLHIPGIEHLQASAAIEPFTSLLNEAKDISFGSTLSEQSNFTNSLVTWIIATFPAPIPDNQSRVSKDDRFWKPLYQMSEYLSSWIAKLCLGMQISDNNETQTVKKEKLRYSSNIASNQIGVLERILLYALSSGHSGAFAAVVSAMWAPVDKADESKLLQPMGYGLMSCIDQLSDNGIYIDTFLSVKLQIQIIRTITRIIMFSNKALISALCSCGIIRSLVRFTQFIFDVMMNVTRLGQQPTFSKEYHNISNVIVTLWSVLIGTYDDQIYEDIIDLGFLQQLVEDWLSFNKPINVLVVDAEYNPYFVRQQALHILKLAITHRPESERLVAEIIRACRISAFVSKEVAILLNSSNSKLVTANRSIAADILCCLAHCAGESLEYDFIDSQVPPSLVLITSASSLFSPAVRSLWLKWSHQKILAGKTIDILPEVSDATIEDSIDPDLLESNGYNELNEKVPLSKDGALVKDASARLFGRKYQTTNKSSIDEKSSVSHTSVSMIEDYDEVNAGTTKVSYTQNRCDIGLIIDRMGHFVLGIKKMFDSYASSSGLINKEDVSKILLDLGIRGNALSIASKTTDSITNILVDFPVFLEIYSSCCGLGAYSDTAGTIWVPGNHGIWKEFDSKTVDKVVKAAEPYSVTGTDVSKEIWIKTDDIVDVLMLTGIETNENIIGNALRKLKHYISDSNDKICTQELLAVYAIVNQK